MTTIVETIHHGQYRNVRTLEIHPVNVPEVSAWLADCPYKLNAARVVEALAGQLCSIAAGVASSRPGTVEHGWIRWEVV